MTGRSRPPFLALTKAVGYAAAEFARLRRPRRVIADEGLAWRELVACIVGSASRYEQAMSATDAICALLPEPWAMTRKERASLLTDLVTDPSGRLRTRFPRAHARYIAGAIDALYVRGDGLSGILGRSRSASDVRAALVQSIPGIGPKQASLLLVNLGRSDDLAVLDRHILRYMVWVGLLDRDSPPSSLRRYEAVEESFRTHAELLGHRVTDLDRAVWLTSRVWAGVMS